MVEFARLKKRLGMFSLGNDVAKTSAVFVGKKGYHLRPAVSD